MGLTGAKLGCGEGGCGACTVLVSSVAPGSGGARLHHRSINACLCPLYAVEGCHVVTVEGVGNPRDGLHPVQERLAKAHGSQCGFCTPGAAAPVAAARGALGGLHGVAAAAPPLLPHRRRHATPLPPVQAL